MKNNTDKNNLQYDIDLLLEKGWKIDRTDVSQAFHLAEKAEVLSRRHNYENGISMSLILGARCFSIKGEYDRAHVLVNQGNEMAINLGYVKGQIKACFVLGHLYGDMGNLEAALSHNLRGLKLIKENNQKIEPSFLNNIGVIYYSSNKIEEAIVFFKDALKIAYKINDKSKSLILSNIADCYLLQKKTDLALKYNNRALRFLQKNKANEFHLAHCYEIFGLIYKERKEWDNSLAKFKEALSLYQKNKNKYLEAVIFLEIGYLYIAQNRNEEGINALNTSMEISENMKSDVLQKDLCSILAETYEKEGNYKDSLNYLKRYNALNEKIKTNELNDKLNQHMMNYKVEKVQKDAEIQRLRNIELKRKTEETALRAEILEEAYQNIKIIGEIGQKITATLNIEKVVNLVYESINKLMDADVFAICLYNEDERRIDFKLVIEQSKQLPLYQVFIDNKKSYAARCVRTKKEIILNDVIDDENIAYHKDGRKDIKPKSMIYYPFLIEDEVIGCMTVQSYVANAYDDRSIEVIKALASYIAIALNNSKKSEELKAKTRELEYLSQTDMLTELYNRRYIINKLEEESMKYQQTQQVFSIAMIDVDNFKSVNDIYGHNSGDYILVGVARVLRSLIRKQDILARWGGEEFLLLLPNTKGDEAVLLCEHLRQSIEEEEFIYNEKRIKVTITLGIGSFSEDTDLDTVISNADKALYEGKNKGRNCVVLR